MTSELNSKKLVYKVIENKSSEQYYIDFIKLFLNDYITFYLENLYHNMIKYFVINDIPHKIILLLLYLKFKEEEKKNISNELPKYEEPLQDAVSKILWLEANSRIIKGIIDLYERISEEIVCDEKEKDFLFIKVLTYIKNNKIKYQPEEPQLVLVNKPFYFIIKILFKCMIDEQIIKNSVSKNKIDN